MNSRTRHCLNTLKFFAALAGIAASGFEFSGCSTLVGNVRPVEEKSETYGVLDLAKMNPDWVKLSPAQEEGKEEIKNDAQAQKEAAPSEVADVAFQSKSTSSIISLNSACREAPSTDGKDLRTLTNLLFLGISDVQFRSEEPMNVQNTMALQTTIQGKLNGEQMRLRTVVLRRAGCIYDLVYMARPAHFDAQADEFSRFVASLRLK